MRSKKLRTGRYTLVVTLPTTSGKRAKVTQAIRLT
jgi:hypothetical protein